MGRRSNGDLVRGLGVCGDICFVHEPAGCFCVSLFVAIIETCWRQFKTRVSGQLIEGTSERDAGVQKLTFSSQESIEGLVSLSREGPVGASPVTVGVADRW